MSHRIAIDARKIDDFGIGTYVRNLIDQLAQLDSDNQYLLLVPPGSIDRLAMLPDNFTYIPEGSRVHSAREMISVPWRLMRLKADLYHATHYVLPFFLPCPAVVTIHDIIHLLFPDFLPNRAALHYARRMIRRSLVRGDRIVTVSQNTKHDLCDYFETSGEKIEVIYNGVEASFREHLNDSDLERWLGRLELPQPYVLFVGNPKPHKNLDNVIKAYARACELAELDAILVCVGAREGSDFKLRQRAEQLGIGDKVRLLGHVAQEALPAIYQGARVFVYPTLYEGFGLPVVEAMASGVPVITSKTSALREIANGYATLVDPLDVEDIARAIARCLTDQEHRQSLAKQGLDRSLDFDWRLTAQATLDLYRRVLGNGRPDLAGAK